MNYTKEFTSFIAHIIENDKLRVNPIKVPMLEGAQVDGLYGRWFQYDFIFSAEGYIL